MSAVASGGAVGQSSRWAVLGEAAAVLWLPALLPVCFGVLREESHCLWTYLAMLPLVPGAIVAVLLHADGVWFGVAAAAPTLLALLGLYAAGREMPRALLRVVQALVVVAVAVEGFGLAHALRA